MTQITLRPYQQQAIDNTISYLMNTAGNPILALPTGAGKGWIIAYIIHYIRMNWPGKRILMAVHNQNLVADTSSRTQSILSEQVGVNCAGLKRKDWHHDVIFGSVQSMARLAEKLGQRALLIVDECHLVGNLETAGYGQLLAKLKESQPDIRILGLSATPWRVGMGLLTNGPVFDEIVLNMCDIEGMQLMFDNGWLVPPITRRADTQIDTAALKVRNGDFTQKSLGAAMSDDVTEVALREFCEKAYDRQCWLVFALSIEHADKCGLILNNMGIRTGVMHSAMSKAENAHTMALYASGHLRCVVNKDMLTTGVDIPRIDAIAMLRPTQSSSLWVQMVGRGLRPFPEAGKLNCLVMDYGGNIERCGPINAPLIPFAAGTSPKGKPKEDDDGQSAGVAPMRICDECGTYNYLANTICDGCGCYLTELKGEASIADILAGAGGTVEKPKKGAYDIANRAFSTLMGAEGNKYLRITYTTVCGMKIHKPLHFAVRAGSDHPPTGPKWWARNMLSGAVPIDATQAINMVGNLKTTVAVRAKQNDRGSWKITKEYFA